MTLHPDPAWEKTREKGGVVGKEGIPSPYWVHTLQGLGVRGAGVMEETPFRTHVLGSLQLKAQSHRGSLPSLPALHLTGGRMVHRKRGGGGSGGRV